MPVRLADLFQHVRDPIRVTYDVLLECRVIEAVFFYTHQALDCFFAHLSSQMLEILLGPFFYGNTKLRFGSRQRAGVACVGR